MAKNISLKEVNRVLPVNLRKDTGMLGITTWPYSVGDKKKLIYLEEWLYASSEGHLGFDTRKFEVYMTERNMYDSYKYLLGESLKTTGWIYSKDLDCFLAPNGTMVSIKAINLKI